MSVAITIPQSARNMFQDGMEQMAQQMQSRFRAYADVKTGCTGKSQAHRKIQETEMNDSTGRLQKTVGEELLLEHRYLFPKKAYKATLLDEDDAGDLDLSVAPTGEVGQQHRMAAGRKVDDIFLAGIIGQNWEGIEDNMQPVALPNTQVVAVGYRRDGLTGNTGLTLAKLIRGKGRFGKNEVYGQEQKTAGAKLCMAVSQDELDNLLYDVEQTGSADYNKVKALVDGEVDYFMGINFMRTERLPTTAPSGGKITRTCPMWVSNGVHLDFWYDIKTSIDVLPTQSQAIQIYSRLKVGACRKDEDRVALVYCEQDG
ncbi:MAG: hypothetical protein JWO82_1476 [Akkermansiaceae bacterium]|nr:hypothetical protein [Akkermansiaceae bacterium]